MNLFLHIFLSCSGGKSLLAFCGFKGSIFIVFKRIVFLDEEDNSCKKELYKEVFLIEHEMKEF